MLTAEERAEVDELCERSKDDRAIIVGSDVRKLTMLIDRLNRESSWDSRAVATQKEAAYRRGFHQGAAAAVGAAAVGWDCPRLVAWLTRIEQWRKAELNAATRVAPEWPLGRVPEGV